jgi:ribosomal protein L3 glutamine methyltransferase
LKVITIEPVIEQLLTVRDLLRWAVSQFNAATLFYGHGSTNAWDEAVYLVLQALHLPPNMDASILDARLLISERRKIAELIQRRINERKPAAYLTQQAWFAGLPFYIDERVIIPRSPIAELIEKGFEPWLSETQVTRILDLCTGSGCIAIACATAFPEAQVDAVDISEEALVVADINVRQHKLEDSIQLIKSDVFAEVPFQQYDLIISNPPYVDKADMQALPEEFQHEPVLALAAGEDGLDIVTRILQEASQYLSSHGILIVEVGNSEAALLEKFPQLPFLWLEFARGGSGVFLLTNEQLKAHVEKTSHNLG